MIDSVVLEEKINSFMQRFDARLNDVAQQIFKLVRTFNRRTNQNQDRSSSNQQNFVQQADERIELPMVSKMLNSTFLHVMAQMINYYPMFPNLQEWR